MGSSVLLGGVATLGAPRLTRPEPQSGSEVVRDPGGEPGKWSTGGDPVPDEAQTQALLRRTLAGERGARSRLLEHLRPRIVLWVSARLSPKLRALVEPEDIAQEVLLALHKGIDGFEVTSDRGFYAWVFRIAENRVRDLADRAGAAKRRAVPREPVSQTTPATAAVRSEAYRSALRAIGELRDDYRQVLQLLRLEERELPEVAAIMERSENAVRILYCRALKALRARMNPRR